MSEPDSRDEGGRHRGAGRVSRGWQALSSTPDEAVVFHGRVLDESPLMLFPGGLVLADRSEILRSMSGAPWEAAQTPA